MGEDLVMLIIVMTLIVSVAGVKLLKPLMQPLGEYLASRARERKGDPLPADDLAEVRDMLGSIDARLERLEHRQDFTDALLRSGRPGVGQVPRLDAGDVEESPPA